MVVRGLAGALLWTAGPAGEFVSLGIYGMWALWQMVID